MRVICRFAGSVSDALLVAQGMENAGAQVFSVLAATTLEYVVFAKYENPVMPDSIDDSIQREMFPETQ